jgi:hypothetical protein
MQAVMWDVLFYMRAVSVEGKEVISSSEDFLLKLQLLEQV